MRITHGTILPLALLATARLARADTAIETETAQIGEKGEIGISNSFEMEEGADGDAAGTLTQFEYGITDRSEILIEPFFQQWEFPDGMPSSRGAGDLELTPSYEFILEKGWRPAMLAAFKLKVPTGSAPYFSSGKFDYYPYLILGEHGGGFTFNANLGVDFITPEMGSGMDTQVVWDLEAERRVIPRLTLFGEVYTDESGVAAVSTAAEYDLTTHIAVFCAGSYDAEHSWIVRPGINFDLETGHGHHQLTGDPEPPPTGATP
jgi:hypothetical protein